MTETADHPTTPTATAEPPPPPPVDRDRPLRDRPNRLYQALAWVGIVAGVVFIVAVVFFSGFILGKHSGGGHGHFGGHQGRSVHFLHRGGPPPMGPMGPQFGGPGAPGGPGGPSGPGSSSAPSAPSSPTTVPAPRP